jgi:hypothetical protein
MGGEGDVLRMRNDHSSDHVMFGGRLGPYLRLRWREENGRKRMKYVGKLSE